MKKNIFNLLLLFHTFFTLAQEIERKVKITKIDSTQSCYYIKGVFKEKPRNKILIVSKNDTILNLCNKIKVGKTYLLKLSNYLNDDGIKKIPVIRAGKFLIRENGYIIWDGKNDLPYKSMDIRSIYYTRKNSMKKKISLVFLSILFINCSTINKTKTIPYILSIEAENSIYNTLKNLNKDSITFYFEALNDKKFKFSLLRKGNLEEYSFSNRKLFINDKFYPLILETDYIFFLDMKDDYPIISIFENEDEIKSNSIKMPKIEERVKNKNLYLKDGRVPIIENNEYWIVDNKGGLIETNTK